MGLSEPGVLRRIGSGDGVRAMTSVLALAMALSLGVVLGGCDGEPRDPAEPADSPGYGSGAEPTDDGDAGPGGLRGTVDSVRTSVDDLQEDVAERDQEIEDAARAVTGDGDDARE